MTPAPDQAVIDSIAREVSEGKCILFLGAGVHRPPPEESPYTYHEEHRPPVGRELSEMLAKECGYAEQFPHDSPLDLQRVSLWYECRHTRNSLVNKLKDAILSGKKPSPALRALARLKFPLIITTNYDQLFEDALREAGKRPNVGVYDKTGYAPIKQPSHVLNADNPFVFKIHGDIGHPESIVITDEDYIQFLLRMSEADPKHPVPIMLRSFFQQLPTIFVGYSLRDYNFRLLFRTLRLRMDDAMIPDAYSVDPLPDPLILDVWYNQRRYVKFIAQDVWTFVPNLYRTVNKEEMPL